MGRTQLSAVLMLVCAVKCLAFTYNGNDELEDFEEYIKRTSQLSPILKKGVEADEYDEDDAMSDNAWEQSGKFEGDLILNDRQRRLIVENVVEGLSRNGLRDGTKRWPNGEVIFFIQVEHFNSDQVQAILAGIEDLARSSCVKFRQYQRGDRDAVVIQGARPGCFSQVGYQGGYQVLNLSGRHTVGHGCFRHGTIVHEMLHTLGFYHMQSSADRDDYIDIQWQNIVPRAKNNFRKYNSFTVSDFGIGYDYDSVLHYSRRAFSANRMDTIVPKKNGVEIGQRIGLSVKDVQKLNRMYCDANSDPGLADEINTNKMKKLMNKPLDIYGLGYHQGKAVIFNVSPRLQPHRYPEMPTSYKFDYFSKAPHILSPSKKENIYFGKKIAEIYDEAAPVSKHDHKMPVHSKTESQKQIHQAPLKQDRNHNESNKGKHGENVRVEMPTKIIKQEVVTDPFDRLKKILKMHVYPSQNPDLTIYKINKQNVEYEDTSEEVAQGDGQLPTTITLTADRISPLEKTAGDQKSQVEKVKSAMHFIDSLYNLNKQQSLIKLNENPHLVTAKGNNENDNKKAHKKHGLLIIAELPGKKDKDNKYVEPSAEPFDDHEDHYDPSHYKLGTDDDDAFHKYYSKLNDRAHSHDDHSDWYHKYAPYKHSPNVYDDGDLDYLKHSEIRQGYYSPSIPITIKEYSYRSPYESDKYNDVSNHEKR